MSNTPEQLTSIAFLQQVTSDYQAVQRERNELIVALSNILANPDGCSLCDSGRVRNEAKGHQPDCVYQVARDLLDKREGRSTRR